MLLPSFPLPLSLSFFLSSSSSLSLSLYPILSNTSWLYLHSTLFPDPFDPVTFFRRFLPKNSLSHTLTLASLSQGKSYPSSSSSLLTYRKFLLQERTGFSSSLLPCLPHLLSFYFLTPTHRFPHSNINKFFSFTISLFLFLSPTLSLSTDSDPSPLKQSVSNTIS